MTKTNLYFYHLFDYESMNNKIKEYEFINLIDELYDVEEHKKESYFLDLIKKYPELRKEIIDFLLYKNNYILINNKEFLINNHIHKEIMLSKEDEVFWTAFFVESGLKQLLTQSFKSKFEENMFYLQLGSSTHKRKNIVGKINEAMIEQILIKYKISYDKQITPKEIEVKYKYKVKSIAQKRFDYVFVLNNHIYLVETNYFNSKSGSKIDDSINKMKETARLDKNHFIYISGGLYWEKQIKKIEELKENMIFLLTDEFELWIEEQNNS